jgi:hypothetical protein
MGTDPFYFKQKHRLSPSAFTRNRRLNFPTLLLYLLNLRKQLNQIESDQFFKHLYGHESASQIISKSALSAARKQLSFKAFIDLNHELNNDFYQDYKKLKTWKGFRLCAIDGSSVRLPNEADITDHFGLQKGKPNQADCPMVMASVFYDVLNKIVIDSSINSNGTSERLCASQHLDHAGKNDLVVYDRGYMGFWLFALHIQQGSAFCGSSLFQVGNLNLSFAPSRYAIAIKFLSLR